MSTQNPNAHGRPQFQLFDEGAYPGGKPGTYLYAPLSAAMNSVLIMVTIFFIVDISAYIANIRKEMGPAMGALGMSKKNDDPDREAGKGTESGDVLLSGAPQIPGAEAAAELAGQISTMIGKMAAVKDQIPMLCILIVFARLRAKVDLEGTEPEGSTKSAFTAVGYIVLCQALALSFEACGKYGPMINTIVQGVGKLGVVICVIIIISSIFTLKKKGPLLRANGFF